MITMMKTIKIWVQEYYYTENGITVGALKAIGTDDMVHKVYRWSEDAAINSIKNHCRFYKMDDRGTGRWICEISINYDIDEDLLYDKLHNRRFY